MHRPVEEFINGHMALSRHSGEAGGRGFNDRSYNPFAQALRRAPAGPAQGGGRSRAGLLIELSSEGCRISNLGHRTYTIGEPVTVELGDLELGGRIRWAHDGIAGVRLDQALYSSQLSELVARDRGVSQARVA